MKKIMSVIMVVLGLATLTGCETWERMKKEWSSNTDGGLDRKMIIYSEGGEVLAEYEGKFDISYSDGRIKFMENGKMRNIYLGNSATVIVEEQQITNFKDV